MEFILILNWWAIVVGVIVTMALGFWWYSEKAFGKVWRRLNNLQDGMGGDMKQVMLCAIISQFLIVGAYNYTLAVAGINPFCVSALIVIGFISPLLAGASIWERRPWKLFWINLGHWVALFVILATIFTFWN